MNRDFYVAIEWLVSINAHETLAYLAEVAQDMLDDLHRDDEARRLLAQALPDWDFDDPTEATK